MLPRFHPVRSRLAVVGALVLFCAGAGEAHAQIRHIDYTNMNQKFSSTASSGAYVEPGAAMSQLGKSNPLLSRWQLVGKTDGIEKYLSFNHASLSAGSLSTGTNPMSGQMDSAYGSNDNLSFGTNSMSGQMSDAQKWKQLYPQANNIPQKLFSLQGKTTSNDPRLNPDSQRMSVYSNEPNQTNLDTAITGPSKFTDAYVFHASDRNTSFSQSSLNQVHSELSLQDVNRYWFQGEHSGDPGLPLTQAGGAAGQPTFSGSGSLTNIPATFDGTALRGGIVPSGMSNDINLITQDGVKPYQPPLGGLQRENAVSVDKPSSPSSPLASADPGYSLIYSQHLSTGAYTTTATLGDGRTLPLQFEAPKMIITAPKGSHVSLSPETPPPSSPSPVSAN